MAKAQDTLLFVIFGLILIILGEFFPSILVFVIQSGLILLILAIMLPLILLAFRAWAERKASCRKFFDSFKTYIMQLSDKLHDLRFRIYLRVIFVIVIFFSLFYNYNLILIISPIFLITEFFLDAIRKILSGKQAKITEFEFFVYLCWFSYIVLAIIISFSVFYSFMPLVGYGSIEQDNRYTLLGQEDAILFSAFTFFSMDYDNFSPQGFLRWVSLIEVFIAQMLIITYIGVIGGKLIDRLKICAGP